MEQNPPEPVAKISPIELLKQHRNNPLFWFLKNTPDEELKNLQYEDRVDQVRLSDTLSLEVDIDTIGQDPENKLNEDSTLTLPLGEGQIAYVIIDGVSSKVKLPGLPEGVSGGFYISHLINLGFPQSKEYQDLLVQIPSPSAKDLVIVINHWVRSEFERLKIAGLDYNSPESIPGVSLTLALVSAKTEKVGLADIADTAAIGKTRDGLYKMLSNDQNAIFDQKVMEKIIKISKETNLTIKEVINSPEHALTITRLLLEASKEKINTPQGCGILNGQNELVTYNLIEEFEIEVQDYDELWLVSDGAMLAFPEVIALLLSKPKGVTEQELREVLNKIRAENHVPPIFESLLIESTVILDQDPQRQRIPRFKDRDDATIIKIKINAGK